jgi:hypothetical protein
VYTPGVLRGALRFLINLLTYQKKKLLAFQSLQIHHIEQKGANGQTFKILQLPL